MALSGSEHAAFRLVELMCYKNCKEILEYQKNWWLSNMDFIPWIWLVRDIGIRIMRVQ
jgi:hypothetical protein